MITNAQVGVNRIKLKQNKKNQQAKRTLKFLKVCIILKPFSLKMYPKSILLYDALLFST